MEQKNELENLDIENNNEIEIEYNEDFENEKTKSLNKFPTKINNNKEFYLDHSRKNFSKSLNFNYRLCFAPKSKSKKSSKNPTPIIFKKNQKINKLDTEDKIITEDVLSEKEASLNNESSFSLDSDNNIIDTYKNDNIIQKNNYKNEIMKNTILDDKTTIDTKSKNNLNDNKQNNNCKNIKTYEHKTINIFNNNKSKGKDDIKSIRNDLCKEKIKTLKKLYKEVEYNVKGKEKIKYRLDLIHNKKNDLNNEYKIIQINNFEENKNSEDNINEDMDKFRATISYSKSKLNKEINNQNDDIGFTIYKVLVNNKKNKNIK